MPSGNESSFPPEVVERAHEAAEAALAARHGSPHDAVDAALSVIADYLRSEEARGRAKRALQSLEYQDAADGWDNEVDAVIAALLGSSSR